jgi:GTP cyclohydrolase II
LKVLRASILLGDSNIVVGLDTSRGWCPFCTPKLFTEIKLEESEMSKPTEKLGGLEFIEKFQLPISANYSGLIDRLIFKQERDTTMFYGCSLDSEQDVWLSPVLHNDEYYQILFVNTLPTSENLGEIPVKTVNIDEVGFKLATCDDVEYQTLMKEFTIDRPQILLRKCGSGAIFFPNVTVPNSGGVSYDLLSHNLKVGCAESHLEIIKHFGNIKMPDGSDEIEWLFAREYEFGGKSINGYGLLLKDDIWRYYELFTPSNIEDLPTEDLDLRIDSGCDIGQVFDDCGCDCREQFQSAIKEIIKNGSGLVIHIPAQDGRGYGNVTKLETEGIKRGVRVVSNVGDTRSYDTITSAQRIFGDDFDIRTYDGVGRILREFGVSSAILMTDNKQKLEGLIKGGVKAIRRVTGTTGNNGSKKHIEAKYKYGKIYFEGELDVGHNK